PPPPPMTAINKSLPKIRKRKSHHRALPYAQVPRFMKMLRERESIGRIAFEFLILTAARSGEVRGALWSEFDLEKRTWTIPAARMKADQEHIVPLADAALAVLKKAKGHKQKDNNLVFPGTRHAKPMSDMMLTKICRDAEVDAVPHGFRSSFRDWVSAETDFDGNIRFADGRGAVPHALGCTPARAR
ncbi:tyrosine-type recombinase/integrase, partial [Novosphingobium sp. AAP83]|uniref:tyrosine-type recombinase/integrase n=1 Tax=Novosphingobium sp. AAP83 TaxID=1523425 RepID=UPI000B07CF5D